MKRHAPLCLVAAALLFAGTAHAQKMPTASAESTAERHFRVGLGLLAGTAGLDPALDLSLNSGQRLYRFRMTVHDNSIGNMGGGPTDRLGIFETALMLGRGRRFVRNYGSVAGGLALVTLEDDADHGHTTIGVPVEAQLISGGPLRLGATLAGNLNLKEPFAAFILSVQVGRVP